jgi:hypothetical protein
MKGWVLETNEDGFQIVNRGEDGKRRFYRIIPGPYSPIIEEEPENSVSLGVNTYVNAKGEPSAPSMKLKGIICKNEKGVGATILYRGNLTNFFGRDAGTISENGDVISVGGVSYQLYRLVAENKNRILGYIGFYMPIDSHDEIPVQILEVEDLG